MKKILFKILMVLQILGCLACGGASVDIDPDNAFSSGECPSDVESYKSMNRATYAIVIEYYSNQTPDGLDYFTMATAFAIDEHLLATNSHVTEGVKEINATIKRVLAVQSQTGEVFTILSAYTHPDYDGADSPDVGLFTTQESLPSFLSLANETELTDFDLGSDVLLVGFPGELNDLIKIIPGETVPQATSLKGSISALRSFDSSEEVIPGEVDIYQHTLPTTPGTSGSAITYCGKVVSVHNAGTSSEGDLNNFGISVQYLQDLLELYENKVIQGSQMPPKNTGNVVINPGNGGGNNGGNEELAIFGSYVGTAVPYQYNTHQLNFTIKNDYTIQGSANWGADTYPLYGQINAEHTVVLIDDTDPNITLIYVGLLNANTGRIQSGIIYRDTLEQEFGTWTAQKN